MTKEELKEEAEDYANRTRIKDKNTYVSFDDECISSLQDYEGNYMDISERIVKTYIDSAEPREKRIAELEKELGKVEGKLADLTYEYYELENLKNNEIAELINKIENLQKYLDTQNCYRECAETWIKLTRAKELIKKIEKIFYSGENALKRLSKISDILSEIEQFLHSEVEE